jgi:hypothetical protein
MGRAASLWLSIIAFGLQINWQSFFGQMAPASGKEKIGFNVSPS